jgi:hypothetical protein
MANVTEFIRQAAALPVKAGKICLITSSNGKRWIIPKGLIEPGQTAAEKVAQEWPERALRQRAWVSPALALERIEDIGLGEIVRAALGGKKERVRVGAVMRFRAASVRET